MAGRPRTPARGSISSSDASRPLPTIDEVRRFIEQQPGRIGKREVARAFGIGTEHRSEWRELLRSLSRRGDVAPAGRTRFQSPDQLPDASVVQVTGTDPDGDAVARPVVWQGDGPPPLIHMVPEPGGRAALAPGERVLARLRPIGGRHQGGIRYEGRTLKRLAESPPRLLGAFRADGDGGRLLPTDRRSKAEWLIPPGETMAAATDDLVLAEPLPQPSGRAFGLRPARVVEKLGRMGDARSVSLICIATHGIPNVFPEAALAEAGRARAATLGRRVDLRATPLVTIDGEDARDFDDAVYAEPDGEGYRLLVAIADVAYYVRPGSALDREAMRRGNSVYFPDRVVPMLPEALSNGWCSLKPAEDRVCLFADLRIDADGNKRAHRFGRGLMRSAARLTYEQIQREMDSGGDGTALALPPCLTATLYDAYRALLGARLRRGTLDLDLPERKVSLDDAGRVEQIAPRPRLDSHRLIEEFMVLANVAAAEELERLHRPCLYRVHAPPSEEKANNLRSFLSTLGIPLKPAGALRPADLDAVLKRVAGTDLAPQVNEFVLRSQSQAEYSAENIGHFGLSLPAYAHFTSPIRRYADLEVHRSLLAALKLGSGGLGAEDAAALPAVAEAVTATERRAALAEREAIDRYLSAYMADKVGAVFAGRISGVTRFGLFVTLTPSGASGLLPISSLPDDYWMHDETSQALIGRRGGRSFRLADPIEVRLAEANGLTGSLLFGLAPTEDARSRPTVRRRQRAGTGRKRRP